MINNSLANILTEEMNFGDCFAYLINDDQWFLPTELKFMQSQTEALFVRCAKVLLNGRLQLFYMPGEFCTMTELLPTMDRQMLLSVIDNLLSSVLSVRNNGFLSCLGIVLDSDRIYVDRVTGKVLLTYLPISQRPYKNDAAFEEEFRTMLMQLMDGYFHPKDRSFDLISESLSDETLSLEQIRSSIAQKVREVIGNPASVEQLPAQLTFISVDNASFELPVTKPVFLIGKKPDAVDGVISSSRLISRIHCKVRCNGSSFTLEDMNSSNGTFINGTRLLPLKEYPIKNDDIVQLASSIFVAKIS